MVEGLINDTAERPLVHSSEVLRLDPAARHQYLAGIERWCRSHAGMTPEDLDLDVLKTTTDANEFRMSAQKRAMAKDERAASLIVSRMHEFPQAAQWLIESLYDLDSPAAVPVARELLKEPLNTYNGMVAL